MQAKSQGIAWRQPGPFKMCTTELHAPRISISSHSRSTRISNPRLDEITIHRNSAYSPSSATAAAANEPPSTLAYWPDNLLYHANCLSTETIHQKNKEKYRIGNRTWIHVSHASAATILQVDINRAHNSISQ